MRHLVETHIMLWWLRSDARLSEHAQELIADGNNELFWSLASSWELAVKISVGKLELDRPLNRFYAGLVGEQNLQPLAIGHEHLIRVATLPLLHRDPFDRLLIAQTQVEGIPILSADRKLSSYAIDTI